MVHPATRLPEPEARRHGSGNEKKWQDTPTPTEVRRGLPLFVDGKTAMKVDVHPTLVRHAPLAETTEGQSSLPSAPSLSFGLTKRRPALGWTHLNQGDGARSAFGVAPRLPGLR